jgi:hypothetical protein
MRDAAMDKKTVHSDREIFRPRPIQFMRRLCPRRTRTRRDCAPHLPHMIHIIKFTIAILLLFVSITAFSESPDTDAAFSYTIAWISDTQNYATKYNKDIFFAMTDYLAQNRERLRIEYIPHTGDVVGQSNIPDQYMIAKAAMDAIADIPGGILAGNHDSNTSKNLQYFSEYFGVDQYRGKPWFGEWAMKDNAAHYDLVTMGSTDFVFVYLSYEFTDSSGISYANRIFKSYPNRVGVLCVHDYLHYNSKLSGTGKRLQESIVAVNPNVYMVLCGHNNNEDNLIAEFDDDGDGAADRTVYQLIANYQYIKDSENGGDGYIRFLEINEDAGTIRFYTYSPWNGKTRAIPNDAKTQTDTLTIPWIER